MNIMLIDDDLENLDSVNNALRLNGFNVRVFSSPEQAIREYEPSEIDVVITDYHLPAMRGTDVIKKIHLEKSDTPVIVISGDPVDHIETRSRAAGAYAFFRKPLDINEMIATLLEINKKARDF